MSLSTSRNVYIIIFLCYNLLYCCILSCALFILVVSEALQAESDVEAKVDLSGLHNVSHKSSTSGGATQSGEGLPAEPVPDEHLGSKLVEEVAAIAEDQEMIFADALSLNSVTTDG